MKKLLLVHAPGLTAEQVVRGDVAANLSDLISEGSFSPLSRALDVDDPLDVGEAVRSLDGARVILETIPFTDLPSFDSALGELRPKAAAAGASIAVLSETVLVTERFLPEMKPGYPLARGDVSRLLARLIA